MQYNILFLFEGQNLPIQLLYYNIRYMHRFYCSVVLNNKEGELKLFNETFYLQSVPKMTQTNDDIS